MDVTRNARRSKPVRALLVAIVASSAVGFAHASLAATDVVPTNQFIPVALTQTLTSATAHVGDTFEFATTKDEKLGSLAVPKGTPGPGRLAVVRPADGKTPGTISIQADSLDLPDGSTVWVNVDPNSGPYGRLSNKHTKPLIYPPVVIFSTRTSGEMILDRGATFDVVTIVPRQSPAPLLTAPPTPEPTPSPVPSPAG